MQEGNLFYNFELNWMCVAFSGGLYRELRRGELFEAFVGGCWQPTRADYAKGCGWYLTGWYAPGCIPTGLRVRCPHG